MTKFRTLIRVKKVFADRVEIVIPGWDSQVVVQIFNKRIPKDILEVMHPGKRLHAKVNRGAVFAYDLDFSDWEPE